MFRCVSCINIPTIGRTLERLECYAVDNTLWDVESVSWEDIPV